MGPSVKQLILLLSIVAVVMLLTIVAVMSYLLPSRYMSDLVNADFIGEKVVIFICYQLDAHITLVTVTNRNL